MPQAIEDKYFLKILNVSLEKLTAIARLLMSALKAGDVLALNGDLGAGKSTLSRAMILNACGTDTNVPSPTFTLVQSYDAHKSAGCDIWHMDWYRLQEADQIWELGVEEAFSNAICLIEWAERAEKYLPKSTLHIDILDSGGGANDGIYDDNDTIDDTIEGGNRTISFSGEGWKSRIEHIFKDIDF